MQTRIFIFFIKIKFLKYNENKSLKYKINQFIHAYTLYNKV